MNKQDMTSSRTPSDTERKYLNNLSKSFAEVMGIATDARKATEELEKELSKEVARIDKKIDENEASIGLLVDNGVVQGSIIIEAINDESTAKISADRLDIEGQELNIKVDAANVEGKLTAEQIDADGIVARGVDITGTITAEDGEIGGCEIKNGVLQISNANIAEKLTAEQIDADGIVAEGVNITGTITAEDGEIGGWTIGSDLTATTVTEGANTKKTQTVTFSTQGVNVAAKWEKIDPNSSITPIFPSGVTIGQEYNKFVSWAELLKVWE